MKLEIVSFTGDSGLADYAVSLARALSPAASVSVVTAQSLPQRFDGMGFTVERVFRRSRHYPVDIFRFLLGVLRRRPDWILVQGPLKFPVLDALFVRALACLGIRTAVTVHDVLPHYPRFWSKAEYGFYYRSFQRTVVHSEAALAGVRALGVRGTPLVVPHGVYDIFKLTGVGAGQARAQMGQTGSRDFMVLFFGHLEPRKGLLPFLEAAEAMKDVEGVKFVLAGGSSLSAHEPIYAQRLEEARAKPNVIVHDKRIAFEDVENYFSACDVVALPYLEGTTSGVLKLALAFGKPVIATRVGDFPEQVPPGAGLSVENDSGLVRSLCNAITTMKADPKPYVDAMVTAGGNAQWADIATRVLKHLQSE
jgi:glycosyltransferase involved in cell wall biosynthesis